MKANLKGMGSIFAVITVLFVFVGCSADKSLTPQTNTADDTVISYSPGSGEDSRDQREANFKLYGQVIKVDANKPLVVLTAKTDSDRDETMTDYFMEVSRDATVVLLRDRLEVDFDTDYVQVGTYLTAFGVILRDGTMLANRFEIWQEDPSVVVDTPSL